MTLLPVWASPRVRKVVAIVVVLLLVYAGGSYAYGVVWVNRVAGKTLRGIADVLHKADVVDKQSVETDERVRELNRTIDALERQRDEAKRAMDAAEARAAVAGKESSGKRDDLAKAKAARRAVKPVETLEEARDVFGEALRRADAIR